MMKADGHREGRVWAVDLDKVRDEHADTELATEYL